MTLPYKSNNEEIHSVSLAAQQEAPSTFISVLNRGASSRKADVQAGVITDTLQTHPFLLH